MASFEFVTDVAADRHAVEGISALRTATEDAASSADLARLLSPYMGKSPARLRWPGAERLVPSCTPDVQIWLESGAARLPGFGMVNGGVVAPAGEVSRPAVIRGTSVGGLPDVPRISMLFDQGYSLVLSDMDAWSPDFDDFLRGFESHFLAVGIATCFVSPPHARAFPVHSDPEDVIVIQLQGSKVWRLGDPFAEEAELVPGDVLYLPPNLPHEVVGTAEGSVHVSVGLRRDPVAVVAARAFSGVIAGISAGPDNPREFMRVVARSVLSRLDEGEFPSSPPARKVRRFQLGLEDRIGIRVSGAASGDGK